MRIPTLFCLAVMNIFGIAPALGGATDEPPRLVEHVKPDYPEALRAAGIKGQVTVQFGVSVTGAVENVSVFKSDNAKLDAFATDAVSKWVFKPATKDGQAVETKVMRVPLTFDIPPNPFRVVGSFEEALKAADQEHKIVFVDFFTTWCEPCKKLDQDTWHDASVMALLGEKTVALKVDAEKNTALAARYKVNAYPTLALIRPDGTLIDTLVGYRNAPTFKEEFTNSLAGKTRYIQAREAVETAGADAEKLAKARYDLGHELARKGDLAAALAEFLWCFDTGMKNAPGYAGVRLSFLLGDISGLGAEYPPALEALRKRRDADRPQLGENRAAAAEFGGINHCLNEDSVTLAEFEKLPAGSPGRGAFGYWVFDPLLEAKKYADAVDAIPFSNFMARFEAMQVPALETQSMRSYLVNSAAKELEALAGAGKLDEARELLKALWKYDHSDSTTSLVKDHLKRAGCERLIPIPPSNLQSDAASTTDGQWPTHSPSVG